MTSQHTIETWRPLQCRTLGDFMQALRLARRERLLIAPQASTGSGADAAITLEFLPGDHTRPTIAALRTRALRARRRRIAGYGLAVTLTALVVSGAALLAERAGSRPQSVAVPGSQLRFDAPAGWLVRVHPLQPRVVVSQRRRDHVATAAGAPLAGAQIWVEQHRLATLAKVFFDQSGNDSHLDGFLPPGVVLTPEARAAARGAALVQLNLVPTAVATRIGVSLQRTLEPARSIAGMQWRFGGARANETVVTLRGATVSVFHLRAPSAPALERARGVFMQLIATASGLLG